MPEYEILLAKAHQAYLMREVAKARAAHTATVVPSLPSILHRLLGLIRPLD